MDRKTTQLKPYVLGFVIFVTLGISIANETLGRFGLQDNYLMLCSVAFIIATVLLGKNLLIIASVVIGVVLLNVPDATIIGFQIDKDVLLAVVCAIVLVPTLYRLISN